MSLITSSSRLVGSFSHLQTVTLNGPRLLNFGGGASGDVLTYDSVAGAWSPLTPAPSTEVFVDPVTNNATYFMTFVPQVTGVVPLHTNPAITYNPNTNTLSSALFSGSLVNVVTINGAPYPPPLPARVPTGNTLTVDTVYGNDGLAALDRYGYYFKTISAALALAASGQNVVVNAGVYNETLTIPDGVSLTGAGAQCVVIQKLNVLADTTLITVGTGCRLENFTANLSSAGNFNLTGIRFPTGTGAGTSITTKMRNSIWTVTSTYAGVAPPNIIGVLSDGTSNLGYNAVNAIQRTTINVLCSGNGTCRGILVSGSNRFSVRDMVVYARGAGDPVVTGTNIMGVETTGVNAYCEIKTSTVAGILSDISRTAANSTILLGFTDLRFNHTNGHSFSVVTESSTVFFGIVGNLKNGPHSYYMVPGTVNETVANSVNAPFRIPVPQDMVLFSGIVNYSGTVDPGVQITFKIFRNAIVLQVYSIVLNPGETTKSVTDVSVDFNAGDTYYATLETVGNPGAGTYTATFAFY